MFDNFSQTIINFTKRAYKTLFICPYLSSITAEYANIYKNNPGRLLEMLSPQDKLSESWRLFTDGVKQVNERDDKKQTELAIAHGMHFKAGKYLKSVAGIPSFIKKEKKYYDSIHEAFNYAINYDGKLDINFISTIRDLAIQHETSMHKGIRDEEVTFGLGGYNMTKAGLEEILLEYAKHPLTAPQVICKEKNQFGHITKTEKTFTVEEIFLDLGKIKVNNYKQYAEKILNYAAVNNVSLYIQAPTNDSTSQLLESNMNLFLAEFEEIKMQISSQLDIGSLTENEAQGKNINNIIRLVKNLERNHSYTDGNCRTFCMVLLNYLLKESHLPFAMLSDPNRFDAYSQQELYTEVLVGMNNTLRVAKGELPLYYDTNNLYIKPVRTKDHIQFIKKNHPEEYEKAQFILSTPLLKLINHSAPQNQDGNFNNFPTAR